jgi:murein DD-endopeptidase MepM/ murein hydrolase activator NlpD
MKIVISLIISIYFLQASYSNVAEWPKGETILSFLNKNNIPSSAYYELNRKDKEVVSEIYVGATYYKLISETNGQIEQVLIPLNTGELQVHIYNDNDVYKIKLTPILYKKEERSICTTITHSLYLDLVNILHSKVLPVELSKIYKHRINFSKDIRKNDTVCVVYYNKTRLGKRFDKPIVLTANIKLSNQDNYIFLNSDDSYYDENAKQIDNLFMIKPVRYKRISSKFTKKRWHPILRRYRAHLGIDYAARKGSLVKAATNGRVAFVGRKGGYGKTIEIKHPDGYKTLYAHLNGYARGIRAGKVVKKGKVIGYVGSTGMSTGPHLHFGLYKHGRPINPSRVIKVTSSVLKGDKKSKFFKLVSYYKNRLREATPLYFALNSDKK